MTYLTYALIALGVVLAVIFVSLMVQFARSQPYDPEDDDMAD